MQASKTWKFLALCMALSMTAGVVSSCGDSDTGSNNTASKDAGVSSKTGAASTDADGSKEEGGSGEITNLIWLSSGTAINEEDKSLVTAEAAKRCGVFVQRNYVPDEKWQVLMASGDMEADILEVPSRDRQQLVEGGLIVPLDDLIAKNAPNIQKTMGHAVDYLKEYASYGNDHVYFLQSHQAPDMNVVYDSVPYNYGVAPYIRWDYYEELGSPELRNEDDLLKLLKDMQSAHPTNDLGRKTYPMSLDTTAGLWSYMTMYSYYNGRESVGNYFVDRDSQSNLYNALQDDFTIWRAANYYNKAWRMGILDPESFTQKGENVTEKITTSQAFYTENSWNSFNTVLGESVGPEAGFEPVLEAFPAAYAGGTSSFGWGFASSITSTTKHPEEAIKFMDYLYSEEGARLFYSGIEGVHWNYVDGVPTFTDDVQKNRDKVEWSKANGLHNFHNWIGIDNMVPIADGYPADLAQTPAMLKANNKPLDNHYCELYGVEFPGQVGKKMEEERDGYEVIWWNGDAGSLMPIAPDDISRILTQCNDILLKAFPKMIMSDSEEDFAKEKNSCIEQLKSYNLETVIDWAATEYEAAKAKVKALN